MTPTRSLPPNLAAPSAPPDYSGVISSAGGIGDAAMQGQTAPEMSPADSAISTIGKVIQDFEAACEAYPGIAEAKKNEITSKMMEYLQEVIGSLNSSQSAQPPAGGGLAPTGEMPMGF